jgi:hypothetical protein
MGFSFTQLLVDADAACASERSNLPCGRMLRQKSFPPEARGKLPIRPQPYSLFVSTIKPILKLPPKKKFDIHGAERYPFDELCKQPAGQLIEHQGLMKKACERLDGDGVPPPYPIADGANGHPAKSKRPQSFQAILGTGSVIELPPMPMTVLRATNPNPFPPLEYPGDNPRQR